MKTLNQISVKSKITEYNITITENLINRFVEFLDVSTLTVRSYRSGISQFIAFTANNGITNPTRNDVLAYKKELIQRGHKPATVALYLSALRRFFEWTESEQLYPNITAGVKAPKQDKGHKRDYLPADALKKIINGIATENVEGLRNKAMFSLIVTCGLRTIEVIRANVEDLATIGGTPILYVQGKGRSDKKEFVKLTPKVIELLKSYLKARGNVKESEPLFVSVSRRNKGQRLTTRSISGICKAAMKQAGYDSKRLTAHSLRHSAVTLALIAGQTLSEVQAFARHTNIATTQIYAHNVERIKSECECVIERAIF